MDPTGDIQFNFSAADGGTAVLAIVLGPNPAPGVYQVDRLLGPLVAYFEDCSINGCRRVATASTGTVELVTARAGDGGAFVGRLSELQFDEISEFGTPQAGGRCYRSEGTTSIDAGL